jgi:hypothetical protein
MPSAASASPRGARSSGRDSRSRADMRGDSSEA